MKKKLRILKALKAKRSYSKSTLIKQLKMYLNSKNATHRQIKQLLEYFKLNSEKFEKLKVQIELTDKEDTDKQEREHFENTFLT